MIFSNMLEELFVIPTDIDQFKILDYIKLLGGGWRCFRYDGNNINLSLDIEQKYLSIPREIYNLIKIKEIYINYVPIFYNNPKHSHNLKVSCR